MMTHLTCNPGKVTQWYHTGTRHQSWTLLPYLFLLISFTTMHCKLFAVSTHMDTWQTDILPTQFSNCIRGSRWIYKLKQMDLSTFRLAFNSKSRKIRDPVPFENYGHRWSFVALSPISIGICFNWCSGEPKAPITYTYSIDVVIEWEWEYQQ